MPQQTDEGAPVRIASVRERGGALVGKKLRLAGRNMCYDENTGYLVLLDSGIGVLVDISLVLEKERMLSWVQESFSPVEVFGYLEQCDEGLPVPSMPPHASPPEIDTHLILRAILIIPSSDLSLDVWNSVVEELEVELGRPQVGFIGG
ncbi:hypothetical protein E1B28_000612 [Marasmius oreades]|uniref:Uncharacterized protein n=1 Tax=Marasmius oreades TaxID=181124 RepID=A0A9P8AEJ9_9AGAR|nr:uncharacterized protein E1B28_000612 [Marasmius oreades]KAG7098699.1 hypothetical protein E1B28_000612 [Marasmius oreades]